MASVTRKTFRATFSVPALGASDKVAADVRRRSAGARISPKNPPLHFGGYLALSLASRPPRRWQSCISGSAPLPSYALGRLEIVYVRHGNSW
jgi:hypothetical protein